MASDLSVCNTALQILGADPISSFTQDSDHARLCKTIYPSLRDALIRQHSWNCAIKRVLLSPMVAVPAFDFTAQFQLPGDWLRTIQVGRKGETIEYRSEGDRILANVTSLPLVYCYRAPASAWSTNLITVMELAVAARLAYAVTKSSSMRDSMRDEYTRELKMAKAVDGQDDPPEEFMEGSFIESRG